MVCQDCDYFDEDDKWGRKGYCKYHRKYYYPEDSTCSKFEKKTGSGTGCYLTTACCEYKGYEDDCYFLRTLRTFRDTYMKDLEGGQTLIDDYYKTAPQIIEKIESAKAFDEYEYIFGIVEKCVHLIENCEYEQTLSEYTHMVIALKNKYL